MGLRWVRVLTSGNYKVLVQKSRGRVGPALKAWGLLRPRINVYGLRPELHYKRAQPRDEYSRGCGHWSKNSACAALYARLRLSAVLFALFSLCSAHISTGHTEGTVVLRPSHFAVEKCFGIGTGRKKKNMERLDPQM